MKETEAQSQQTQFLSVIMMIVSLVGTIIFISMIVFLWWTNRYENSKEQAHEAENLTEVFAASERRTLNLLEGLVPQINAINKSLNQDTDTLEPQLEASLNRATRYLDGIFLIRFGTLHEIARKSGMTRAPTVQDGAGLEDVLHEALAPYGLILQGGNDTDSKTEAALTPNDIPHQFLLRNGDNTLLATIYFIETTATIAPASERKSLLTLIGIKKIDDLWLAQIMKASSVSNLRVAGQPNELAVPFQGLSGLHDGSLFLTFEPDRPGDRIVTRISPFLFAIGALFFVLMILQSRRVLHNLAQAAAIAHRASEMDVLSGLPNRRHFIKLVEDYMAHCNRINSKLALFYVDIDRFKEINDCFGHDAGDRLIVSVSERLRAAVKPSDCVARLGGDEFAILAQNIVCEQDAITLADKVMAQFSVPFDLESGNPDVTPSIGIALFPDDAQDRSTLMRMADFALYRAKHGGRNQYRLFDPKLRNDLALRKTIERELREAITTNQLSVVFQPIMSQDGKTMVAVEALTRWFHPVHGNIPPDIFIAIAEELGLICKLGTFIFHAVCEKAVSWPNLRIAVNISPIELKSPDFVAMIGKTLRAFNLNPERFELELTERVVVDDAERAEQVMLALRMMGVRLALDDFGTGYSSLIYLRRFPLDKIKIDKSFVSALEAKGESSVLVESIIQMGHALGLTVTAEGIETQEQHALLQSLNCDEMQGYLFSRPVPAEAISTLYDSQHQTSLGTEHQQAGITARIA